MSLGKHEKHAAQNIAMNSLYGALAARRGSDQGKGTSFTPFGHFRQKIREGNLNAQSYLALAGFLLPEKGDSSASLDTARMVKYCLEKSHELAPYNKKTIEHLLNICRGLGESSDAVYLGAAREFLASYSGLDGRLKMGIRYLEKGNTEKAEYYFGKSCEIDKYDVESMMLLVDVYSCRGDIAAALSFLATFETSYELPGPFSWFFWGLYGRMLYLADDLEKSAWSFEKALSYREAPVFMNSLAQVRLNA
ncbi:MAG: hypothetical protein WCQ99_10200, partial [Pseudomonadota bacterium]